MHVIPAINATSLEQAREQLVKVAPFAETVHLDIADGMFTANKLWGSPVEFQKLFSSFMPHVSNFEVHLMVARPEEVVEAWLAAGARRIIAHVEVMTDPERLAAACRGREAQAMAAIIFSTPDEQLVPYLRDWSAFQILAVTPGKAGQQFQSQAVDKVRFIHSRAPRATIEVDGGINAETAAPCKAAGADALVSAHYLFASPDPRRAYEELRQV